MFGAGNAPLYLPLQLRLVVFIQRRPHFGQMSASGKLRQCTESSLVGSTVLLNAARSSGMLIKLCKRTE